MKSLILLPCSNSKKPGGLPVYKGSFSVVRSLPQDLGVQLVRLRRELFDYYKDIAPGHEICQPGQAVSNSDKLEYMEAFERYSVSKSLVYSRITHNIWNELAKSNDVCVLIVSALYRILNYNEPIQNYNRAMDIDKVQGTKLQTWWNENGLPEIVKSLALVHGIGRIYSFLSKPYAEAVGLYQLGFDIEDFPELNCGIGTPRRRGEKFNSLVSELIGSQKLHPASAKDGFFFAESKDSKVDKIPLHKVNAEGKKANRYAELAGYLESCGAGNARLSFAEIEEIIGGPLPPSARKYNSWWANDKTHTYARWLDAGWCSRELDLDGEKISFVRISI